MQQRQFDSPLAARARDILLNVYTEARTPSDAVAVILLLYRILEDVASQHLEAPASTDMVSKINALEHLWPTDLHEELDDLRRRRNDLAHPRYINGAYAQNSAEHFVNFCLDNWTFLFQTASRPPVVPSVQWVDAPMTPETNDLSRRLRSVLLVEYGRASTPNDMLAAALLFHKAIEQSMEQSGAPRDYDFNKKIDLVFRDPNANRTLRALHLRRSHLAHAASLNESEIVPLAGALAGFVGEQWGLLGDGYPVRVAHPPILARYVRPTAPASVAQQTAQPAARPAAPPAASGEPAERRQMAWGLLLKVVAQLALAFWLLGVARSLWAGWPDGTPWPAVGALLLVLLFASRATRSASQLLDKSGNFRGGLALLGVAALFGFVWLSAVVPRALSGRHAGQLLTAYASDLMVDDAAPASKPVVAPPAPTLAPVVIPADDESEPPADDTPIEAAPAETADPAGAPSPAIAVGATVRVATQGNNLNGRAEPGLGAAVVASFGNGAALTVVDGPRTADGYTWWLVRSDAGEGWSAADFLVVASP